MNDNKAPWWAELLMAAAIAAVFYIFVVIVFSVGHP